MKTLVLSAALMAAGAMAQAATISLYRSGSAVATISCGAAACEGWTGSGWSDTSADLFTVHPPNDAIQAAWVGGIVGEDFTGQVDKDETGTAPTGSMAEYVLFKLGGGNEYATALLRNVSGGAITYTFTETAKTFTKGKSAKKSGAGLSHTNSFGSVVATPLPASGVLLGLGLLASGAFAARRRRKA